MATLGRVLLAGLLGGSISGLILTGVEMVDVLPLILEAESYEQQFASADPPALGRETLTEPLAAPGGPAEAQPPDGGLERVGWTAATNAATSIGLGLVLCGCFALRRGVDTREGALWGLAGFAALFVGPALSLPPELPGSASTELLARRLWWLFAAASSAGGLALIAFRREGVAALAGAALILLPHIVGAPSTPEAPGTPPASLQHAFAAASLVASGVHWVLLGTLCAFFFGERRPRSAHGEP